jgi:hypothetical protein
MIVGDFTRMVNQNQFNQKLNRSVVCDDMMTVDDMISVADTGDGWALVRYYISDELQFL